MPVISGQDVTFLGVPRATLADPASFDQADIVIVGAPFDGGTTYRAGARFGPQAIRTADCDTHNASRPHLALRVDPLVDLRVVDAGDVDMRADAIELRLRRLEEAVASIVQARAVPVVLGGDHSVTRANVRGVARHHGAGRIALIHFDAHADTADVEYGSAYNHATPIRRLVEAGVVRGDRVVQIGLRGYWPGPEVLAWMEARGLRGMEMSEVVTRGLDACLDEAIAIARDGCDGAYLTVALDVADPAMAPGTGTPEPGGLTSRQLLDAVRRCALELPLVGLDVVEVAPPYDYGEVTAYLANRVVLEALSGIAKRRSCSPLPAEIGYSVSR